MLKTDNWSLTARINAVFSVVLLITVSLLIYVSIELQKKQITAMMETQVQQSAANVVERMSLLRATVDSREFNSKLNYYLATMRSEYLSRGIKLSQIILGDNGDTYLHGLTTLPFSNTEIQYMHDKQQGILHNPQNYSFAYCFSSEQQALVVLMVNRTDYYKHIHTLIRIMLLVGLLALFSAYLISWWRIKAVLSPLKQISAATRAIQNGNFEVSVPKFQGSSEIAILSRSFSNMSSAINSFIKAVAHTIAELNSSSSALGKAASQSKSNAARIDQDLAVVKEDLDEQMQGIARIHTLISMLLISTADIDEQTQNSLTVSGEVLNIAEQGQASMVNFHTNINNMNRLATDTQQAVQELNNRLKEISFINSSTRDIARRTSLLALNAAIEAARAGENGRGFGVVAQEVGKLAEESSVFAEHIASLIDTVSSQFTVLQSNFTHMHKEVILGDSLAKESVSLLAAVEDKAVANRQYIQGVTEAVLSMTENIKLLAEEVDAILQTVKIIENRIPSVVSLANEQNLLTGFTLDGALQLDSIAAKLQHLINSLGQFESEAGLSIMEVDVGETVF